MNPPDPSDVTKLKAQGRKKIIELARKAALEAGSHLVPESDDGVKVFTSIDSIKVVLAKGYRAYTDGKVRRIETITVVVMFKKDGEIVYHEGDDVVTEDDKRIMELVLKKMPANYQYDGLTIIDDPDEDPNNLTVELDGYAAMGRHRVNKATGEWMYVTHKHYALSQIPKEEEWEELK